MRQREMLIEVAAKHAQHMQKALTQMNIKVHNVISDITGKTGLAIIGGERNRQALAQLRHPRIRADTSTIARSLEGHSRDEHLFELEQARDLYRVYKGKVAECDERIEALLGELGDSDDPRPPLEKPRGAPRKAKNTPAFDARSYPISPGTCGACSTPAFDARSYFYQVTGVDLTRIDGVDASTALKVIREIGWDMSRWENVKHSPRGWA